MLGPTGWMLKGPIGTSLMEKGPSKDFYDELQASRMSNYRSHGLLVVELLNGLREDLQ